MCYKVTSQYDKDLILLEVLQGRLGKLQGIRPGHWARCQLSGPPCQEDRVLSNRILLGPPSHIECCPVSNASSSFDSEVTPPPPLDNVKY